MNITKLTLAYFSPTLSTKRILLNMARGLKLQAATTMVNITSLKERSIVRGFGPSDLLIVAVPTYGGRLPSLNPTILENFKGTGTPTVPIVVYGDRGYDDTLLEMKDLLEQNSFITVAAAAFIAEHASTAKVGTGRPDAKDLVQLEQFGEMIRQKIRQIDQDKIMDYVVKNLPGNFPYKVLPPSPPLAPITTQECVMCLLCHRWCPTDAIDSTDPNNTDPNKCIKCRGCVKRCPTKARKLESEAIAARITALEQGFSTVYNQPEIFL